MRKSVVRIRSEVIMGEARQCDGAIGVYARGHAIRATRRSMDARNGSSLIAAQSHINTARGLTFNPCNGANAAIGGGAAVIQSMGRVRVIGCFGGFARQLKARTRSRCRRGAAEAIAKET